MVPVFPMHYSISVFLPRLRGAPLGQITQRCECINERADRQEIDFFILRKHGANIQHECSRCKFAEMRPVELI